MQYEPFLVPFHTRFLKEKCLSLFLFSKSPITLQRSLHETEKVLWMLQFTATCECVDPAIVRMNKWP